LPGLGRGLERLCDSPGIIPHRIPLFRLSVRFTLCSSSVHALSCLFCHTFSFRSCLVRHRSFSVHRSPSVLVCKSRAKPRARAGACGACHAGRQRASAPKRIIGRAGCASCACGEGVRTKPHKTGQTRKNLPVFATSVSLIWRSCFRPHIPVIETQRPL
jgi:hypothetical protein